MLMRVQLSSASPGGSTASTYVLLVRREMVRLKRGVLMKNSWNWCAEDPAEEKFLDHEHDVRMDWVTYDNECLNVLTMLDSRS